MEKVFFSLLSVMLEGWTTGIFDLTQHPDFEGNLWIRELAGHRARHNAMTVEF